jgi:hypothetical protein
VKNGLVKKSIFDSYFFGNDNSFREEELKSYNNNSLTFSNVKLMQWCTYKPSLYDNYDYRRPQLKALDMFSFLYLLSENQTLFDGIKEFFTSKDEFIFSANFLDLFFSRRDGENISKIFRIAWNTDGKNWAVISDCRVTDNCFSFNTAYALMVIVD